jgi:hypothetical protein
MNLLTREVPVRKPSVFLRHCVIAFVASLISSLSLTAGMQIGYRDAYQEMRMGQEPVIVETDACGIADPVACAVQALESVTDLFRSVPGAVVTPTPTTVVVCAEAEHAYWACVNDVACPLETFEKIADDVNFCQTRH